MPPINPQSPKVVQQQLARARAELVRLRVKQNTLAGRVSGSAAVEGARSGALGKQRKQGGPNQSLRSLQQEQEMITHQIATAQETIASLEARLAEHEETNNEEGVKHET